VIKIHKDILGQELSEGCFVAVARHSELTICKVVKLHPRQMRVSLLGDSTTDWLTYSSQCVKISGEEVMIYILKYAK
jgi:hypothetical protein